MRLILPSVIALTLAAPTLHAEETLDYPLRQVLRDYFVDIPDFLALLAQWGQVDTSCDFDGEGVSVTDFLTYLANFGPCPTP